MSDTTINSSIKIVEERCYLCQMVFMVPARFQQQCRNYGETFYCPLGHSQVYSKPEVDRLKEQIEIEQRRTRDAEIRAAQIQSEKQSIQVRLDRTLKEKEEIEKGFKKAKTRTARGVCPAGCNRTFAESRMERHIKTKHPDFAK